MSSVVILFFQCIGCFIYAQSLGDTLVYFDFEDPNLDIMVNAPSGQDQEWLIYDEDGKPQNCIAADVFGFFPNFDWYGDTNNTVLASCSWTDLDAGQNCMSLNRNWLISEPLFIPSSGYRLEWKSASHFGPFATDGYKVLLSTSENSLELFTDTLFIAASTINNQSGPIGGVNPANYDFSPGYVHADTYTDTDYFELVPTPFPNLIGLLEPHAVHLDDYAGQIIYIAFLHDTYCNYLLEFDDILVHKPANSAYTQAIPQVEHFRLSPNPSSVESQLSFSLTRRMDFTILIQQMDGKVLHKMQHRNKAAGQYQVNLNTKDYPSGVYSVLLATEGATVATKLIIQN